MALELYPLMLVLAASGLGGFGALYLKLGSEHISLDLMKLIKNYKLIAGLSLYAIAAIVFIYALKFADVSVLYPFVAMTYVWTCLLSVKVLKEKMNKWKWLGIVAILIGVTLIGIGS